MIRSHSVAHWLGVLALSLLAWGCASRQTVQPSVSGAALEKQTADVQNRLVADAIAREARVLRIAWPVLTANRELCRRNALLPGWRVGDAQTIETLARSLKRRQVKALGWTGEARVLSIVPGGPADEAGLKIGDVITHLNGEETPDLSAFQKASRDRFDDWPADDSDKEKEIREKGPLELTVLRDKEELSLTVAPEAACSVNVVSSSSSTINAFASFRTMTVTAGLLRALPDDNAISFIIAHELAHIAAQHPRKIVQNAAVTGTLLWAPPLVISAGLIDSLSSGIAQGLGAKAPPLTTLATKGAARAVGSVGFEREADYVGLYMHVRAGGVTDDLPAVFQMFSNLSARQTWLEVTHPVTPERQLRLLAAAQEINAKQSAGDPLLPEGWPRPSGDD